MTFFERFLKFSLSLLNAPRKSKIITVESLYLELMYQLLYGHSILFSFLDLQYFGLLLGNSWSLVSSSTNLWLFMVHDMVQTSFQQLVVV